MMTCSQWKAEILRRFPKAEFIEETDGMTARANDADCGWWLASSFDDDEPDCWIAEAPKSMAPADLDDFDCRR